jgi:hypothetical protein
MPDMTFDQDEEESYRRKEMSMAFELLLSRRETSKMNVFLFKILIAVQRIWMSKDYKGIKC